MRAVRLPTSSYSASSPAPSSALRLDPEVPVPKLTKKGEFLVKIKASPVIRDELTWPETYSKEYAILGHDFSGVVVGSFSSLDSSEGLNSDEGKLNTGGEGKEKEGDKQDGRTFKKGDEVYGMVHADKGGIWAEYAIVERNELSRKPKSLMWAEAAAVPLSALTAWQALFVHGGLKSPDFEGVRNEGEEKDKKVFITGASGGVGIYLVQLAKLSGVHVVAGTTSVSKNGEFLQELEADEVVEYSQLEDGKEFDVIIDTVGGATLENCWKFVKPDGKLISIESSCFNFVEEHKTKGLSEGRESVDAKFFIVECSGEQLDSLGIALEKGLVRSLVSRTFGLEEVVEAYAVANGKNAGRGKVVLVV